MVLRRVFEFGLARRVAAAAALVAASSSALVLAAQLQLGEPKPKVALTPPRLEQASQSKCAECHAEIVEQWASTAHALAWVDHEYQEALAETKRPDNCHGCHAPSALIGLEPNKKPGVRAAEREMGVSCESCHVDSAGKVHGPRGTPTDAHPTQANPLLTEAGSSVMCASCHRFNIGPVVGIAKDFETAKLAERGLSCVACHFQSVEARFATAADGKEVPVRKGRSHAIQTPRDPAFLEQAFALSAEPQGAKTLVRIENRAGHRIPGLIGRKIEFELELLDAAGARIAQGKVVLDTGAYLPVDGKQELVLAGTGPKVRVVGRHLDPRAKEPMVFVDRSLSVETR